MNVKFGNGPTVYGPGVLIELSGRELALAISAYLVARNVDVVGPRTIYVNGESCEEAQVYVDPSGAVVHKGKRWNGNGQLED